MKIFFLLCIFLFSTKAFAFNPKNFNLILGFEYLKDGALESVQKHLGSSKEVITGDASTGHDVIYYVTKSHKEIISFWQEECQDGYDLVVADQLRKKSIHPSESNVEKVEIQGVYLGMDRKELGKILKLGKVEAGFFGRIKSGRDFENYSYGRKLKDKAGHSLDDEIDIFLKFGKDGKLIKLGLSEGECD